MSVPVAAAPPTTVTVDDRDRVVPPRPRDLTVALVLAGVGVAVVAALVGLLVGPVPIGRRQVVLPRSPTACRSSRSSTG
jgi:hypothetical protein